ncbi:hypothetical protein [Brucella gallinifaecis]|uniref:hypothetical protein n=1 Tax=Brucella gallinifaecis TaxID=215590 RepID=UPI0023602F7E|nr:hypothetical protein [Brucella gallinifaecis]
MGKLATFDGNGFPVAFYWIGVHEDIVPSDAIEITEEQWLELIDNAALRRWDGERVVEYTPPEPIPEELHAQMPPLSRRQFWLGANSLGLSKADVLAATDDPIIIIEIKESGEFHRDYESILMLAPLLGDHAGTA